MKENTERQSVKYLLCKLMLIVAIVYAFPVQGQSYLSTSNCTGTICRNEDGRQMIYMQTSATSGYFLNSFNDIYDLINAFKFTGYTVSDFTMINDTLFAIGNTPDGIGYYALGVANPGIQPDPIQFRVYTLNNLNDGNYIKNPKRIKVFREGANRHAVIIGEYVPADKASTKSVLLHIKNNLPNCEFAYTDDEQYDDLTLTNDYVVTVQRKGHDEAALFQTSKPDRFQPERYTVCPLLAFVE